MQLDAEAPLAPTQRRRKRRFDRAVLDEVARLAVYGDNGHGLGPKPIAAALRSDPTLARMDKPGLRTLQELVTEARALEHEPWSLAYAAPGEAQLVLPVLGSLIETRGWPWITRRHAGWIARLREAVPDLPPPEVDRLAWSYHERAAAGDSTADLDRWLALRAWEMNARDYVRAFNQGWIDGPLPWTEEIISELARQPGELQAIAKRDLKELFGKEPTE